jgi:hypothetical protein
LNPPRVALRIWDHMVLFPSSIIAVPLGFATCSILEYNVDEQSDGTFQFRS